MRYVKGILILYVFTLLGEWLNRLLPLPVPTGVYGLFLLLAALCAGVVKLETVEGPGGFLLDIMPLLFIPVSVGLIETVGQARQAVVPLAATAAITTVIVLVVTGLVAEAVIRRKGGEL